MNPKVILVSSIFLVPGCVFAGERDLVAAGSFELQGTDNVLYRAVAAEPPPPPASETGQSRGDHEADVHAQLEAARKRLEEAARQVAELSAELNGPLIQKFSRSDGSFRRGIIGVQLDPASGKDGARVLEVSPGGPAAEAGIRSGDVIVAVNGAEVKGDDTSRQVMRMVRDVKPDSKLNVRVLRDGKIRELTVTARPGPGFMLFGDRFPDFAQIPPMRQLFMVQGPLSDMELATLTPQLGRYFGTDKGVLVVRAPAEGALKLEDGDVILAIDGRVPTSGSHATRILSSYQPGEKITLRIMRQRKTLDLETNVPEVPADPHKANIMGGRTHGPIQSPERVVIGRFGDETI